MIDVKENMNKTLKTLYKEKRDEIDLHIINNFMYSLDQEPKDVLREMLFCVCTPQTDAHKGWKASGLIIDRNIYLNPSEDLIASTMREAGVRFHKNKARAAFKMITDFYPDIKMKIKSLINEGDIVYTRNHLAKVIKGWGLKEASHFLRNVGYGEYVAILDRHILRRLVDQEVIDEIPKVLDKNTYLEIEQKMLRYSKDINVPMTALDLLFWYQSKGEFFK